jgi:hypothetical protein
MNPFAPIVHSTAAVVLVTYPAPRSTQKNADAPSPNEVKSFRTVPVEQQRARSQSAKKAETIVSTHRSS